MLKIHFSTDFKILLIWTCYYPLYIALDTVTDFVKNGAYGCVPKTIFYWGMLKQ